MSMLIAPCNSNPHFTASSITPKLYREHPILPPIIDPKSCRSISPFSHHHHHQRTSVGAMSGAQGANPPGAFTDTTYASGPGAETEATKNTRESSHDDKGIPVKLAADDSPNPTEAAGLGGPVFGANEGPDKGVVGTGNAQ